MASAVVYNRDGSVWGTINTDDYIFNNDVLNTEQSFNLNIFPFIKVDGVYYKNDGGVFVSKSRSNNSASLMNVMDTYLWKSTCSPQHFSTNADDFSIDTKDSGFTALVWTSNNTKIQEKCISGKQIINAYYWPIDKNVDKQDTTKWCEWLGFIDGTETKEGRYWNFYNDIYTYDNFNEAEDSLTIECKDGDIYITHDDTQERIEKPIGLAVVWIPPLNEDIYGTCYPSGVSAEDYGNGNYPHQTSAVTLEHAQTNYGAWGTHLLEKMSEKEKANNPTGSEHYFNISLGEYTYSDPCYYIADLTKQWEIQTGDFSTSFDWSKNFTPVDENHQWYDPIIKSIETDSTTLSVELPSYYEDLEYYVLNNMADSVDENRVLQKNIFFFTAAAKLSITLNGVPVGATSVTGSCNAGRLELANNVSPAWGAYGLSQNIGEGPTFTTNWTSCLRNVGKYESILGIYHTAIDDRYDNVWSSMDMLGTWNETGTSKGFYRIIIWR